MHYKLKLLFVFVILVLNLQLSLAQTGESFSKISGEEIQDVENSTENQSENRRTIAVLNFSNKNAAVEYSYLSMLFADAVYNQLDRMDSFKLISTSKIQDILEKRKIPNKDLFDQDFVVDFCNELNAEVGVMGSFTINNQIITVEISVIDIYAELVRISYSEEGNIDNLFDIIDSIALTIATKIKEDLPPFFAQIVVDYEKAQELFWKKEFEASSKMMKEIIDRIQKSKYADTFEAKNLIETYSKELKKYASTSNLVQKVDENLKKAEKYLEQRLYGKAFDCYEEIKELYKNYQYKESMKYRMEETLNYIDNQISKYERTKRIEEDYSYAVGLGMACLFPVGVADFLNITIEPIIFFDFTLIKDWGRLAFGFAGSVNYHSLKTEELKDNSYVLNIPLILRCHYLTNFNVIFHIYAGLNTGLILTTYQMDGVKQDFYTNYSLKPDIGVNFNIIPYLGLNVGMNFDIIFLKYAKHVNISPYLTLDYKF